MANLESLAYETQLQIALNLPYEDVIALCGTSKTMSVICKDEYFWEKKMMHDGLTGYTPDGMPWEMAYRYLYYIEKEHGSNFKHPEDILAANGQLDILLWLENQGLNYNGIRGAVKGGPNVLDWFLERDIFPKHYADVEAAKYGNLDTLRWLEKLGGYRFKITKKMAVRKNHIGVLRWLERRGIFLFDFRDLAFEDGHDYREMLRWLERRGLIDYKFLSGMSHVGDVNFFRWLERRFEVIDSIDIETVVTDNHIEVLRWLERRGRFLTSADVSNVVFEDGYDYLEMLRWLERRGLIDSINIENTVDVRDLNFFRWLERRGILPDLSFVDYMYDAGNYDVSDWLERRNIEV